MKKNAYVLLAVGILLAACGSHGKKITVYASSAIQVDETQKVITVSEGTTHHETTLDFSGGDPVSLSIKSPAGSFSLQAGDDGLYIVNLQTDTVVGSYQHVGESASNRISRDQLQSRIDSLNLLVVGKNVSDANKNYFIPPGKIQKITPEVKAKIFGPYTSIPSSFDAGSAPEIYKFYTNGEVRDIIDRLTAINKTQ